MYFGACVLMINGDGHILAVSRKDDKNDFGLPGGKVEPGETPIEAAMRELYEETGFKVSNAQHHMIYHAESDGKLAVTYQLTGELKQISTPTETGVVSWVTPDVLAAGKTFGEYNRNLFKAIGLRLQSERNSYYNDYGPASVKKKG
jgi:8-oxo-dGTP pyrophosphatase MutT (NUDIX family)